MLLTSLFFVLLVLFFIFFLLSLFGLFLLLDLLLNLLLKDRLDFEWIGKYSILFFHFLD